MRLLAAGLLSIAIAASSLAQATGEVESVGFNNLYRPGCWVPMVVRLVPETTKTDTFQLQVMQRDLDHDTVIYTRTITLTGNTEGQPPRVQRFWMYFVPQPTDGGLPDPSDGLPAIKRELRVYLCTASGKQLVKLPITATVTSTDASTSGLTYRRGHKLILAVSDGTSQPAWHEYDGALGLLEDVEFVAARPADLPENALGYEGVDSLLWLNADPATLSSGTGEKMRALQDWVRQGGRLVISQSAEWRRTVAFNDLLPVLLIDVVDKRDLDPLRSIATRSASSLTNPGNPWNKPKGPFKIARAQANPGAVVDEWINWDAESPNTRPSTQPAAEPERDRTPYLVRAPYGAGSTTWVAQDLGDPAITRPTTPAGLKEPSGWTNVWDRVFDWKNDPVIISGTTTIPEGPYSGGTGADMGASLLSQVEFPSRSTALVFLAIVFFIAYWVVAGPGTYLFLAGRKQSGMSWFIFAASALVATAITMGVTQLVLRGKPSIRHISFVRIVPDQPAIVRSRIGLYIPRDGEQRVVLKNTAPNSVSYVSPMKIHPFYLRQENTGFSDPIEYQVPVREAVMTDPPSVGVPYRSTLKKLEAKWIGNLPGGISGTIKLAPVSGLLEGNISNNTGKDLKDAYFAFHSNFDWVLYVKEWPNNTFVDLTSFARSMWGSDETQAKRTGYYGKIYPQTRAGAEEWLKRWYSRAPSSLGNESAYTDLQNTFPMLSLFDRLPVCANPRQDGYPTKYDIKRIDFLRRGARFLDLSQIVSAGQLVVLATADGPLPIPVEVEGDAVAGEGTILYQFVHPLDRTAFENPTTQPATKPAPDTSPIPLPKED